jgi:predicted dehydrogenase
VDSFVLPPETDEAGKDPFKAKIRDYCDAIRDGRTAPVPGEEILVNQAILDGIYRSAKLHREVEIDIPRID